MLHLEDTLAELLAGRGAVAVLLAAFALGLRHAADPDHLVAVSTLVVATRTRAARAAGALGAAWGAGHAATLLAFGLPVVLAHAYLPALLQRLAEALIGAVVLALGVQVLLRWRRGAFHAHVHEHAGGPHAHVHSHLAERSHEHRHGLRSPRQAFAVGLVHGAAGSASVAVLVVAAVPDRATAVAALVAMVAGAAVSMTLLSAAIGRAFAGARAGRVVARSVPALAAAACVFGVWYAAAALA